MSTTTEPLYYTEWIDGRAIEKPLPKKLHALIQRFLILALSRDLRAPYIALPELNVLCGEDRLVPDITVTVTDSRYIDGDLAEPPLLGIEILSPGQALSDLLDKCERLLKHGTPRCWIIWPERRQAWMYTTGEFVEAHEKLSTTLAADASVEVPLADMWASLD